MLKVDREKCVGCCRCVDFAPLIFDMDDGMAKVLRQPEENEMDVAYNAKENCPEQAILFNE